jgi:acyl transferase domain-containing protein/SAM-dependent methyltransferase/acyl carrier protein
MTDRHASSAEAVNPVKRALIEIRDLRARLARAEAERSAPIAIVGMGLRFPGGVTDAETFARLLWSGTDAVGPIPADRWSLDALYAQDPDAPGKMITRRGAFLEGVDQFDADFFGIAPREAVSMDPQQRLLLEIGWEALENAGHAPATLAGTNTGVYLGIANGDYGRSLLSRTDLIDAYASSGNAYSVAAGRLSYFLGLHGPSMAVDTACSSSLVALHLACQGLRLGECDMALAGGSNLILTPEMNISFSKARMMAPDGSCKTFDAAADGYVRGEGCAVLVLRRLADAMADGDRILAVVRGSAVNQDGRSAGLTAPNGPAQEAVIRAALSAAGLPATAVDYVEAHGTGTPLGDPIEVGALAAVFGPGRDPGRKLAIGSVKTNIGHLEAAAGIAGVIKVVLAMQRREIPPHLHFQTGNPRVDWAALPITVPVATTPWPAIDTRRLAGVSSFGFSGCNAHVILEGAPPPDLPEPEQERPLHLLVLSARDRPALMELARRYASVLSDDTVVADVCYTAGAGRSHFAERLAVVGADASELRLALGGFVDGIESAAVAHRRHDGAMRPQVAFLFTGEGAQYAGMGRGLYETSPTFRRALDECADGLAPYLEGGLLDALWCPEQTSPINRTAYAQPALFAIEYAFSRLWRSWGIEPAAVLGHSLGEYAAACVAGLLPLRDALRLVAERGRLTEPHAEEGAMAAVFAAKAYVDAVIGRSGGALCVAAHNGPDHFVISGKRDAVASAVDRMQAEGVRARKLRLSYAAHSRCIEPVLPAFRPVLETVRFEPHRIALVSNVTGALAGSEIGRPDYWLSHMRMPVQFDGAMKTLAAQGITHCIEMGPHPVLLGMAADCLPGQQLEFLPSLRRDRPVWSDLLVSVQRLYLDGAEIDWDGFERDYRRRRIALPTYPFRRQRYWMGTAGPPAVPPASVSADERWSRASQAISRQARQGPLDLNVSSYPAKWACLARLTSAHAVQTLRACRLFGQPAEAHTLEQALTGIGAGKAYRRLIRRWLDGLVVLGILRRAGERYVADATLPDPGLAALWAEAEQLFADNRPLLAYVRHCGALLGPVLRGTESPLETLFPRGSFDLAEDLYERSATMRYVNALAAAAVGSTSALLPVLPAGRTQYWFTDVSDFFFDRARERFAGQTTMTIGRLDLDQDLRTQGYPFGSIDVVVAANAVHASVDVQAALRRLRELLAPGGVLILIESTTHFAWFDITTGLIEGWQHFADDLRTEQPLMAAATWVEVLADAGFERSDFWPAEDSPASHLGQHVLVARIAGEIVAEVVVPDTDALGVTEASPLQATDAGAAASAMRKRILAALPGDRIDLLRDFVRQRVVRVLRRDTVDPPDRHDRLTDLGLDSLMAVQLRGQLGCGLGFDIALPATLMFDYPTIDKLAAYLLQLLCPEGVGPDWVCPEGICPEGICPEGGRLAADQEARSEAGWVADPQAAAEPAARLGAAAVAAMTDAEIEVLLSRRVERRQSIEQTNVFSSSA